MPVRTGGNINAANSVQGPRVCYEAVLAVVAREAVSDPYWPLCEEADDAALNAQHYVDEEALIVAEIETRRGDPVYCQAFHLPRDLPRGHAMFQHQRGEAVRSYTVYPSDLVEYRPQQRKEQGDNGTQ